MLCNVGLVIFALHRSVVAINSTGVQYEKAKFDDTRISHTGLIYELNTRSNIECAVICEQTDICVAFSSNQHGSCELSKNDPSDEATGTEHKSGWRMYIHEKCWPDGYDGFVLDGVCYFWNQSWPYLNWSEAQADCQAQRSHLTCIGTETANEAIEKIAPGLTLWLGIYKHEGDEEFTCNGKNLTFSAFGKVWTQGPCAMVLLANKWAPQKCTLTTQYVCEKKFR